MRPLSHFRLWLVPMLLAGLLTVARAADEGPAALPPPTAVASADAPNDVGNTVILSWELSAADTAGPDRAVTAYQIERADSAERFFAEGETLAYSPLASVPYGTAIFSDSRTSPGREYRYRVAAIGRDGRRSPWMETAAPVRPVFQWFDSSKTWFGVILLTICGLILGCIALARLGRRFYVRPIAGLAAVEEAVGRATEMGRRILYVPGIMDMNEIQTVAGLNVLGDVAKLAAAYETPVEVPTTRALVMTTAREVVQGACLEAGKPEAYDPDKIYYVTDDQFSYTADVCGSMHRDPPAACFYLGQFFAEALLFAETGNAVGAIQVAGTAETTQLPFFVAACDYTLLGEELFAASAYLSGEPTQLGSLKGQDLGKLLAIVLLVVACVTATAVELSGSKFASVPGQTPANFVEGTLHFLKETLLNKAG